MSTPSRPPPLDRWMRRNGRPLQNAQNQTVPSPAPSKLEKARIKFKEVMRQRKAQTGKDLTSYADQIVSARRNCSQAQYGEASALHTRANQVVAQNAHGQPIPSPVSNVEKARTKFDEVIRRRKLAAHHSWSCRQEMGLSRNSNMNAPERAIPFSQHQVLVPTQNERKAKKRSAPTEQEEAEIPHWQLNQHHSLNKNVQDRATLKRTTEFVASASDRFLYQLINIRHFQNLHVHAKHFMGILRPCDSPTYTAPLFYFYGLYYLSLSMRTREARTYLEEGVLHTKRELERLYPWLLWPVFPTLQDAISQMQEMVEKFSEESAEKRNLDYAPYYEKMLEETYDYLCMFFRLNNRSPSTFLPLIMFCAVSRRAGIDTTNYEFNIVDRLRRKLPQIESSFFKTLSDSIGRLLRQSNRSDNIPIH